jgi:hypothetical protein
MAFLLPLAHATHWLWVLYLPPLLIVLASLLRSKLLENRAGRDEETPAGGAGEED